MRFLSKKPFTIGFCAIFLIAIAWADYKTAYELRFFTFFFLPVAICAWYGGRTPGILLSVFAALLWMHLNQLSRNPDTVLYLNAFLRLIAFVIVAIAVSQMRLFQKKEMKLKQDLSEAYRRIVKHVAILKKVADGDPSAIFPPGRKDAPDTLEESFTSIVDRLTHQKALENKLSELEHQALIAEAATHLSHEIRNPLNLIMLTAHQLGRQFAPEDEVRRANYLELIASLKEETDQLSSVVSRFIEMGRHSAPIKVLCIPSEIIGHVVIMVRQKLSEKDIVLEQSGDLDAALEADPAKLRLVFLNLIVNAIAAVPDKGKIVMHGEYDADKKRVTYSVTDNGPGIPEDDLNNIFEPYFTKREGGTGLGLALVRRIIADHDGTISVRNMPAGGACFEIVLPAGVPQP